LPGPAEIRRIQYTTLLMIDLDNTLIDRDAAFRTGVAAFLAAHRLPAAGVDWVMEIDASGYATREVVSQAIIDRYGHGLEQDHVIDFLRRGAREHARVTPETEAALRQARSAGHQVVIVTNGAVPQQTGTITASGLDGLVDGWVVSEGVGSRKPEPGIFHGRGSRRHRSQRSLDDRRPRRRHPRRAPTRTEERLAALGPHMVTDGVHPDPHRRLGRRSDRTRRRIDA
jgi:nicotinamidase-related amidase